MKIKSVVISCIITVPFFLCCDTGVFKCMENNKEYVIWTHMRLIHSDDTDEDVILDDYDDLKNMPVLVKAVVARFAAYSPDYIWNEDMKQRLTQALGDFSSLEEAQKALLEIWGKDYAPDGKPVSLTIKKSGKLLLFNYGFVYGQDRIEDKFKISGNGNLKWIARHSKR